MKIEQQVGSLALAKRLKEAGYPQDDSLWYWVKDLSGDSYTLYPTPMPTFHPGEYWGESYAAPTVAELGEALPKGYISYKDKDFPVWKCKDIYNPKQYIACSNTSEADCRAEMWLYLKEKGLL